MTAPLTAAIAAIAALAWATAGSAATPPSMPLDRLLSFQDPEKCVPGAAFQRLKRSLSSPIDRASRQPSLDRAGKLAIDPLIVPRAYRNLVGRPVVTISDDRGIEHYQIQVPIRGTWRGLPVTAIGVYGKPESDSNGFWIRFAATAAQLRIAANRLGFAIPATGERVVEDDLRTYIGVRSAAMGSDLYCSTG